MKSAPRQRFWSAARVVPVAEGFAVRLDARPLRTPGGQPLTLPTEPLAREVAAEWNALEDEIRPERLPVTRAANSAIDRVAPDPDPVIDALAAYGESDLVCYRAEAPEALQRRQAEAWDPWLDWSREALGAPLVVVAGVMHHPQPAASLARLRAAVAGHDAFGLTGLYDLVTLSCSLVLGLAVSRGVLPGTVAWGLSRIDEDWQAEQWGEDEEAAVAARHRRADFLAAERLLTLARR